MTNNGYHCRAVYSDELKHHGVKGQVHGVRRYQYKEDGSLTPLGREHYGVGPPRETGAEVISRKYKAAKKSVHDYVVKKKRQRGLARARKAKAEQKEQEARIEKAKRDAEEAKIAQEARIEKAKRDAEEAKAEASKKSAEADVTNAETKQAQAESAAAKEAANDKKFSSKEYAKYTDEELSRYIERKRLENAANEERKKAMQRGVDYVNMAANMANAGIGVFNAYTQIKQLKQDKNGPDYQGMLKKISDGKMKELSDKDLSMLADRLGTQNRLTQALQQQNNKEIINISTNIARDFLAAHKGEELTNKMVSEMNDRLSKLQNIERVANGTNNQNNQNGKKKNNK